jgi:hypothetical protein
MRIYDTYPDIAAYPESAIALALLLEATEEF